MKDAIIANIKRRLRTEFDSKAEMRAFRMMPWEEYMDDVFSVVYSAMTHGKRKGSLHPLITLSTRIGRFVVRCHGDTPGTKFNGVLIGSRLYARIGVFLLYTLEQFGLVRRVVTDQQCKRVFEGEMPELQKTYGKHIQYGIQLTDQQGLYNLCGDLREARFSGMLPRKTPAPDWTGSYRRDLRLHLIKTHGTWAHSECTPEKSPMVYEAVNRAQKVGWMVNEEVLEVAKWAIENEAPVFSSIWLTQNKASRSGKLLEQTMILDIADKMRKAPFYHVYTLDFRGRKYPVSSYLHEQGSGLARGLLLRHDKLPMTRRGFEWLLIYLASTWAGRSDRPDGAKTDKIPMSERIRWSLKYEELLIQYAEDPRENTGWIEADKPWIFLAGCIELRNLRKWQAERGYTGLEDHDDAFAYFTGYEAYVDGSTNGSQHLAALTRDEQSAQYVNLVPMALPGDLYAYVAEEVWNQLELLAPQGEDRLAANKFLDRLLDYKRQLNMMEEYSEEWKHMLETIKTAKKTNAPLMDAAAVLFWLRVTDMKERRKICKRAVMTISYGSTPHGMSEQILEDSPGHKIDHLLLMDHKFAFTLGYLIHKTCSISLTQPMHLLEKFKDAGRKADAEGIFLRWHTPLTNFPVEQHYVVGADARLAIEWGPPVGSRSHGSAGQYANTMQLRLQLDEQLAPAKGKQTSGISPNVVHSMDAAHLIATSVVCSNPPSTIHDSFGTRLAEMDELFAVVREVFVELYKENPLFDIMQEIGGDTSDIKIGTLDISNVLQSDFCFA